MWSGELLLTYCSCDFVGLGEDDLICIAGEVLLKRVSCGLEMLDDDRP